MFVYFFLFGFDCLAFDAPVGGPGARKAQTGLTYRTRLPVALRVLSRLLPSAF